MVAVEYWDVVSSERSTRPLFTCVLFLLSAFSEIIAQRRVDEIDLILVYMYIY